ncbi:MAG: HPF/RaiA family ribosome-associated protein [Halothiobacillaceae bacterium]
MQLPLQITFRDIPPSEAIEAAIREKAKKLERYFDRITSCRVIVEAPHKHHHKGKLYEVSINITIPGHEIVVSHDNHDRHEHEDIYVSIRDAFMAAKRQLEACVGKMRGEVKVHEMPAHGRVIELTPDHGTILTPDGREVYFHPNSLLNAKFETLEKGAEVRFAEEAGDKGPKATSVHVIGKHHIVD